MKMPPQASVQKTRMNRYVFHNGHFSTRLRDRSRVLRPTLAGAVADVEKIDGMCSYSKMIYSRMQYIDPGSRSINAFDTSVSFGKQMIDCTFGHGAIG